MGRTWFGRQVHRWFVQPDLFTIFTFRQTAIEQIFAEMAEPFIGTSKANEFEFDSGKDCSAQASRNRVSTVSRLARGAETAAR